MNPTFYEFARSLSYWVFRLIWGLRVIDAQRVPPSGAVIIACNHLSYLDPPVLGCGLHRPVTYLAKKQLFAIPILGPIIRWCGAYPLDREAGGVAALRAALRVLKAGQCVGIFPEGTRNLRGDAQEKGGAALLASLSGAPVVPAAIVGTKDAKRFARIRVIYGAPIAIDRQRKADGDDLEKWTALIMQRIRSLEESIGDR